MNLVQKLAENPLGDLKRKKNDTDSGAQDGQADETVLLEQTLSKISGLLQVGFGMAGSEVIGKSMSTENDGEFNYMLAGAFSLLFPRPSRARALFCPLGDARCVLTGKKITSVFGFAIIEEFTNTCSCLEEETCTYVADASALSELIDLDLEICT